MSSSKGIKCKNMMYVQKINYLQQVKNAADIFDQEYVKISAEWLLSTPLDMIILPETDIKLREERIWRQVDAVKKSRIIFHAAADPLTRPGPRWLPAVINLRKNIEALHSAIKKE